MTLADYLGLPTKVISIHALREEGDQTKRNIRRAGVPFLSTPSARRVTNEKDEEAFGYQISIHALREEGDLSSLGLRCDRW